MVLGGEWTISASAAADLESAARVHFVTNVAQCRALSGADYLAGCDCRLTGTVTMVDPRRELLVLQDDTGAIALNFTFQQPRLAVGQLILFEGTNCSPYCARFPGYPFRPAVSEVSPKFETPMNIGEYYLTRMRGFVRPSATGEYRFWIASDNSSELWLSPGAAPSRARKIAEVPRFGWVVPHDWSRYPSQCSTPIVLNVGETYYIEAVAEQTTGGDNLSVAWQGPGVGRSVITQAHLRPWPSGIGVTNGILREYWTNFTSGELVDITGPRAFESALSVQKAQISVLGPGDFPGPEPITLNQQWKPQFNYRWVQVEGVVKFAGMNESGALLEISEGTRQAQIHAPNCSQEKLRRLREAHVQVQGVCEGSCDPNGVLVPGVIWAPAQSNITLVEVTGTNASAVAEAGQPAQSVAANSAMQGFYVTHVLVTFNGRVMGEDYIFVQEDTTGMRVSLQNPMLSSQFEVGHWVELGGTLEPGNHTPIIAPLSVSDLGRHSPPQPLTEPLATPAAPGREGRWSEIEGVVHSVNSNGMILALTRDGPVYLWLNQTPTNQLAFYVDARLRARGVLLLSLLDAPVLLVPSRDFVETQEQPPEDAFAIRRRPIAELFAEGPASPCLHRVRVFGQVTYKDAQSFFIEDATAGIRVRTCEQTGVETGKPVEVVGFPAINGFERALSEPLLRAGGPALRIQPKKLLLSDSWSAKQGGTLVRISATLLARKSNARGQILELQQQQRVFVASLATGAGSLPEMAPGSTVQVTGVCEDETTATPQTGENSPRAQMLTALNILLRSPADVALLGGPPWWTWKRTATLVGALLSVLVVSLSWVHLLRRRLERQQAAQVAFSRQVLEKLEDERRRIAVNLHDSLGQILMAIKYRAQLAIQRSPDEQGMRQRFDEISGITSQAIEEVRQITHGLRPYQLDRLGLTQAIRASVNQASANSSIQFASRVEVIDGVFDKDAEIHVYRIVQEAVTNVVKHSAATEATVVIKKRPGMVLLSIRDNGRGFEPATVPGSTPPELGYGLSGIAERVRILGGMLSIDSKPGEGARVNVEVPLIGRELATHGEAANNNPDSG
jgi:signal transduction histidine kinase